METKRFTLVLTHRIPSHVTEEQVDQCVDSFVSQWGEIFDTPTDDLQVITAVDKPVIENGVLTLDLTIEEVL